MKRIQSGTLLGYMARDQYGQTYHLGQCAPRKALLEHFGRKHARRMFVDRTDGKAHHIGWIIAGHWLTVYCVHDAMIGGATAPATADLLPAIFKAREQGASDGGGE